MTHLWRIDGTLNWPDWKKVHERGRSREPYAVRITQADFTRRHVMDQLHLELNRIISAVRAEPKKAKPKRAQAQGSPRDARALYEGLSLTTQTLLRTTPDAQMDRSAVCMAIVKAMLEKGYSNDEMVQVYDLYPGGPFSHYKDREGFLKDVDNIRSKSTSDNAQRIAESLDADESSGQPLYRQAPGFRMDETGLTEIILKETKDGIEKYEFLRCGPFEVLCWASDPKDNNPTLVLRFKGRRGIEKIHLFECADIHRDRTEMARRLTYSGLHIEPSPFDRDALAKYLSFLQKEVKQIGVGVRTTGWHDIEGERIFVLPHEIIGPPTSRPVYLQTDEASRYSVKGTLDEWKVAVGNPAGEYPHLALAVSLSFTGPLMVFVRQVGIGVHYVGSSSLGKTTSLQVAASSWASGAENGGFVVTYQSTVNALEMLAMLTSDTLLAVDEMSVARPETVFELSYRVFGGAGRSRLNGNASLKETPVFRIATVSTGEQSVKEKIAEGRSGRRVLGGQEVRLINVRVGEAGIFEAAPGPAQLAQRFKAATQEAYGTAGPAFVRALVSRGIDTPEVNQRVAAFVAANVAQDAAAEVGRVANAFGLIAAAGELATEFGVVDWVRGTATRAAVSALRRWVDDRGGEARSTADLIIETTLRERFMVNAEQFQNVDKMDGAVRGERIGFTGGEGEGKWWSFTHETWRRVLGSNEARAIQLGKEKGWLKHDKGRDTAKVPAGEGERTRMIVVTWEIFGDPAHPALWGEPKDKANSVAETMDDDIPF